MKSKTAASTVVRMSELMTPADANFLGKVFGGAILSMLDKVAYVTASRFAGTICVTASFDRVDFHSPIEVGELVHMIGSVDYAGRTSVQTRIEVYAEDIHTNESRHTNSCVVTMVAIDSEGKPTPVPKLIAETRDEKMRFLEGRTRREMGKKQIANYEELKKKLESMSEAELDKIIESGRPVN